MTRAKAERIVGQPIGIVEVPEVGIVASTVIEMDPATGRGMLAKFAADTEKEALAILVEAVYVARSNIVRERAGHKCEFCGSITALRVHHRVYRSHGRDDSMENLCCACPACHERLHKEGKGTNNVL